MATRRSAHGHTKWPRAGAATRKQTKKRQSIRDLPRTAVDPRSPTDTYCSHRRRLVATNQLHARYSEDVSGEKHDLRELRRHGYPRKITLLSASKCPCIYVQVQVLCQLHQCLSFVPRDEWDSATKTTFACLAYQVSCRHGRSAQSCVTLTALSIFHNVIGLAISLLIQSVRFVSGDSDGCPVKQCCLQHM